MVVMALVGPAASLGMSGNDVCGCACAFRTEATVSKAPRSRSAAQAARQCGPSTVVQGTLDAPAARARSKTIIWHTHDNPALLVRLPVMLPCHHRLRCSYREECTLCN